MEHLENLLSVRISVINEIGIIHRLICVGVAPSLFEMRDLRKLARSFILAIRDSFFQALDIRLRQQFEFGGTLSRHQF